VTFRRDAAIPPGPIGSVKLRQTPQNPRIIGLFDRPDICAAAPDGAMAMLQNQLKNRLDRDLSRRRLRDGGQAGDWVAAFCGRVGHGTDGR